MSGNGALIARTSLVSCGNCAQERPGKSCQSALKYGSPVRIDATPGVRSFGTPQIRARHHPISRLGHTPLGMPLPIGRSTP